MHVAETFRTFKVVHAQCAIPGDRQLLLAVLESTFGELKAFDKVIRGLKLPHEGVA